MVLINNKIYHKTALDLFHSYSNAVAAFPRKAGIPKNFMLYYGNTAAKLTL
jgi:hypothetical protein